MKRIISTGALIISLFSMTSAEETQQAHPKKEAVRKSPIEKVDGVNPKPQKPGKAFLKKCDSYAVLLYGIYRYMDKDKAHAVSAYDLSIKWDPSQARAYFFNGVVLMELGRLKEAEASYLKSIKLEPTFFYSYYNLACVTALDKRQDEAINYADLAMQHGYDRYENFTKDADLKSIHSSPKLAKVIQKHKAQPVKQSKVTKFLLASDEEKLSELLTHLHLVKQKNWKQIADQALLDTNRSVRIYGMLLYYKYGEKTEKIERLVRSLFDCNSYVIKAAANKLVEIGDDAMPYIELILESGREDQKFFARQVKTLIQRNAAIKKEKIK